MGVTATVRRAIKPAFAQPKAREETQLAYCTRMIHFFCQSPCFAMTHHYQSLREPLQNAALNWIERVLPQLMAP